MKKIAIREGVTYLIKESEREYRVKNLKNLPESVFGEAVRGDVVEGSDSVGEEGLWPWDLIDSIEEI